MVRAGVGRTAGTLAPMVVLKGEGRVPILYGRQLMPTAPNRPLYLSRPDVVGRHPGVVVLHGDGGLEPAVRDLCRRLARHGYVAPAPDLFRESGPGDLAGVPSVRAVGDAVDAASALRGAWSGFTEPTAPAVLALGASAGIGAEAAGSIGGPLVVLGGPVAGLAATLPSVRGPILGLVSESGDGAAAVRAMHESVGRGEWVVFPGVGPDFFDDGSDDFDLAAFTAAFERMIEFLDRHLSPVSA